MDWDSHGTAFKRLQRQQQITTAKLIHKLANTNLQNRCYYGKDPTCPCCSAAEESWEHVLSCPSEAASNHRTKAMKDMVENLKVRGVPEEILSAIQHGITKWIQQRTTPDISIHAQTVGSLKRADVLLTMASREKISTIGWLQLFHGRLRKYWGKAIAAYLNVPTISNTPHPLVSWLIHYLWHYTRSLWIFRNQIVHGSTDQEAAAIIMSTLHNKVKNLYTSFQDNPHILLPRHQYLFLSRPLAQQLKLDIDSINCWIRSVEIAQQALLQHNIFLQEQSQHFFAPFLAAGQARARLRFPPTLNPDTSTLGLDDSSSDSFPYTTTDTISTSATLSSATTSTNTTATTNVTATNPSLVGALAN